MAVGYCRRSTDRQEQSIPDQKKTIERYCAEQSLTLLRWYVDDAISGTSSVNRPGFQQLIADAQRTGCDFSSIVVYDVKRFGRVDNDEAGYYRHLLRTSGVEVLYATEGFSGGETDDLLRPVKQWQARQESKDLSKVTIRGLLSKSATGAWMGGVPPHGYDLKYQNERGEFLFVLRHMPDGTKRMLNERGSVTRTLARGESVNVSKRDRAVLVPGEEDRVRTVRRIFELYVQEGRGLKAVADELNRTDTPTPRGSQWSHIYAGLWRDSTVRAILVNPIYAGDMVWNRRTDARFHMIAVGEQGGYAVERRQAHGARLVPNDESDWIIVRDTHGGLVSRKLFEKAKSIRLERPESSEQAGKPKRPEGGWTGSRSRFILSGLCRCALCGSRYQGLTRTKGKPRADGSKVRTYSYGCGGYIARGKSVCSFNPVGQEALENAVIEAVLGHYAKYKGKEGLARLTEAVRESLGIEAADLAKARARLDVEQKQVEAAIANLLDHMTEKTRDLAEQRLGESRTQRQKLDVRRGELDHLAGEEAKVQETVHELARFIDGLEFTLRHGLPAEKMAALRRCASDVRIGPDHRVELAIRQLPLSGTDATDLCVFRLA